MSADLIQDKDHFLQAAKRTPVNLQEWAVSMMERHNRKSYLAPPAPKALNRDGSRDSTITGLPSNHPSNHETASASSRNTQTSRAGERPTIATQEAQDSQQTPTGIAQRSPPPPLSLEHLSLETQDMLNGFTPRSNRLNFNNRDNIPEPASAIEPTARPMFPPKTSSNSTYGARGPWQGGTLPVRPAPPPTGPLPVPPGASLVGSRRGR